MRCVAGRSLLALLLVFVAGCQPGTPSAPAPVAPPTTATIRGHVVVAGTPRPATAIDIAQKPDCVEARGGEPLLSEGLLIGPGGGLRDTFIHIVKGLEGRTFEAPPTAENVTFRGCAIVPHVLVVRTEQRVEFATADTIEHNLNVKGDRVLLPSFIAPGTPIDRTFRKGATKLQCDIHPWESAALCVTDHPSTP